ncbi:hypothetical protein BCR33DRAFT_720860 [Rhizoclosmatium globosum]|uniref:Uncharacterized protein n=1 Tax=Rhizoclosmatium globosum TaxID=329046 RepID=A0A1Y2BTS9_9FUNG|nr:hypothetical protein BCR33DRAFT_720860 [Rhizoclosmatium globosum]|eukprot:ORY38151.1 hypothetical protein BCR33DRAFT_720860 [Rhizoclosmatium globosum]
MFPKYINYFQWFVRLSPVVFVLTVIVDAVVISMNLEGNTFSTVYMYLNVIDIVLTALSGWTAVIFDTTVFFAFVYYLRKISADADISLDKRLKIIAQFGAVTSLLGMVIFVFNVLGVLFPLHTIPHIILYHVAMLFLDIVVLLLVVMKHHLITEKEKQTSNIILSGSPDKSASKEEQESDSEMGLWRYLVSRIFGIRSSRKDSTIRTSTRKPESRVLSRTTTTSKFGSNNGVEAS